MESPNFILINVLFLLIPFIII